MPNPRTHEEYAKHIKGVDRSAKMCVVIAFILAHVGGMLAFESGGALIASAASLAVLAFFMLRFPDGPQL